MLFTSFPSVMGISSKIPSESISFTLVVIVGSVNPNSSAIAVLLAFSIRNIIFLIKTRLRLLVSNKLFPFFPAML